ncbi:hypothetical protein ACFWJM_18590 [Streptomyces sp. NPDC127077]|uniref:hypothetical protein n=1 Tax=Streptomyces sp. NPDC127077 TaxID=3347131 RepID=UPI00365D429C
MAQFDAAGGGPFMIVLGPGEVQADRLGLPPGNRRGQPSAQLDLAFGGVALFAEHDVQAVAERVPAARTDVVRGQRGPVQRPGPCRLLGRGPLPVLLEDVLEECLHDVPGRHLPSFEARPHAVGVTLPKHPAPTAAPVEPVHKPVQIPRELQYLFRELSYSHHSTPRPT